MKFLRQPSDDNYDEHRRGIEEKRETVAMGVEQVPEKVNDKGQTITAR